MLYDNAQLARLTVEAWQVTGDAEFRRVAEETLDYVVREMVDPSGGFRSTQDADSEGEEGKFFLWELRELEELSGSEDARLVAAYYDVTPRGNFEGKNILHVDHDLEAVAKRVGVSPDQLRAALDRSRPKLFAAREKRVKPGRDDKVLAEWNGMMLRAFAYAAGALGRDDYRQVAERNGEFLLQEMVTGGGWRVASTEWRVASTEWQVASDEPRATQPATRNPPLRLFRSWAPASLTGGEPQARFNAYLEDYANVVDGLVELYELTFDLRWLEAAKALADAMIELFWDERNGGFFQTSHDHEGLIARPKDFVDNAVPSGNSVAADVLLRLGVLTGDDRYAGYAETILLSLREGMARQPLAFGHLLSALERVLALPQEVAIIGDPADERTQALLAEVRRHFLPNTVTALAASSEAAQSLAADVPLLAGRGQIDGQPTAYVCENFACQMPVTEPRALAEQLENLRR